MSPAPRDPSPVAPGLRRIPVTTPAGDFPVWTQRLGDNPRINLLLLHGGPGVTHDTMGPVHMQAMPKGRHLHCPLGSRRAMVDDEAVYLQGLLGFLREVDANAP